MQSRTRAGRLLHPAQPLEWQLPQSLSAQRHNLPFQLSSFVGRQQEVAAVAELLVGNRLLTLTGVGGVGKTRLGLQVAAEIVDKFTGGVWLVELAPVADPALVPQAMASTLHIRGQPGRPLTETLIDRLRPNPLLLVLDNCEHVVQACAELAEELLRACPNITILATSREQLGVTGEVVWLVPSLCMPHSDTGQSLAQPGPGSLARRQVLFGAARAPMWQGDAAIARERFEQLRALATDARDWERQAGALTNLGLISADVDGDVARARALTTEALTIRQDHGDQRGVANCLQELGLQALGEGKHATARRCCEEAVALLRALGDTTTEMAFALDGLGRVNVAQGDLATARGNLAESLGLLRRLENPVGLARTLHGFSRLVIAEGQLEFGFRLFGVAAAQAALVGLRGAPNAKRSGFSWLHRLGPDKLFARARQTLGEEAAWKDADWAARLPTCRPVRCLRAFPCHSTET